jgi:Ca2+-binding EF-hand superfamily protein
VLLKQDVKKWAQRAHGGSAPSEPELTSLMTRMDTNNDGVIDFDEFTSYVRQDGAGVMSGDLELEVSGVIQSLEQKQQIIAASPRGTGNRWQMLAQPTSAQPGQSSPRQSHMWSSGSPHRDEQRRRQQQQASPRASIGKLAGRWNAETDNVENSPRGSGKKWQAGTAKAQAAEWPTEMTLLHRRRAMFEHADDDQDGLIGTADVRKMIQNLGSLVPLEPLPGEIKQILHEMDRSGNGTIYFTD